MLHDAERLAPRPYGKAVRKPPAPRLAPRHRSQLRDRLLAEINAIGGADDAALWAQRTLPRKEQTD